MLFASPPVTSPVPLAEAPRDCPLCPRLVRFREECRAEHPGWWNAPVPAWGDPHAWLAIYPAVHVGRPAMSPELTADLAEHNSGFTAEAMAFIGACYGATADDPYGYIGHRHDLAGLPRCLVVNDQYDELRASGEALARQLAESGVEVRCSTAEGMKHGHLNLVGHPVTRATMDEMAAFLTAPDR